uniref:AP2/ERF domain-containing protein n=1 Tax=Euplotes crassus TaxID=5936 RepID=A0A7S3KSC9_EUPCR|mmetsp:Transcript_6066/g.5682  ORF Transcript_6066/g.5682 Transcript_6066/m.5682 type:complete len:177 (+) Transcript_6066:190-720(+)
MDQQSLMPLANKIDFASKASAFKRVQKKSQKSLSERETLSEESEEYRVKDYQEKEPTKHKGLDISDKLMALRTSLLEQSITGFTSSQKKAKSVNKKYLKRRSKYIGVSRNNANWQALINVNKIKRYIGTFSSELQAAEAYDLYSFAIRGEQAPLNFAYTPLQMLTKIETFLSQTPP